MGLRMLLLHDESNVPQIRANQSTTPPLSRCARLYVCVRACLLFALRACLAAEMGDGPDGGLPEATHRAPGTVEERPDSYHVDSQRHLLQPTDSNPLPTYVSPQFVRSSRDTLSFVLRCPRDQVGVRVRLWGGDRSVLVRTKLPTSKTTRQT